MIITGAKFVQSSTHRTRGSCSLAVRMLRWVCGTWTYRGKRQQSGGRGTPARSVAYPSSGTSKKCGQRRLLEFDRYAVYKCLTSCMYLCSKNLYPSLSLSLSLSFSLSHIHTHSITVESVVELCVPSVQTKSPLILQWDMRFLSECVPTATQKSLLTSKY